MDTRPVRIYSNSDAPRLRYIAGIILGDILGLTWDLITDKRKLGKHPVINYSSENIPGSLKVVPDTLLFETGVVSREIVVSKWKTLPVFFQTTADSDIPFDIFAASFYMVSRYEEYLDFNPDEHGRYPAAASLSFRNGFLGISVVELWAREMSKAFLKKNQTLTFRRNEYKSLLTIDIDQPYAYLNKGLFRTIGGLLRDVNKNEKLVGERYRILSREEKDPFEVFDYIKEKIKNNKTDVTFFFPTGDHSKYDKNPSWKNQDYRKLIHDIACEFSTGLHPSYHTQGDKSCLNTEKTRLKTITEKDIISSRFHYLRLFLPGSYRSLIEAGIKEDYSMGYPDEPGFRAGISRPYYFYDVLADRQTSLRIIPFQIMDVTLYNYKKLDPAASKDVILDLISETKKAGGLFVSIWHNTSLLDDEKWTGWRELFESMLKMQT